MRNILDVLSFYNTTNFIRLHEHPFVPQREHCLFSKIRCYLFRSCTLLVPDDDDVYSCTEPQIHTISYHSDLPDPSLFFFM
ncbi:unnamed protein product [Brugia pahangi]|uniref:Ovule protein n=1 Tax=Brugia pahangi TaxID=6280 RepID=A0A0N4TPA8_BRUPA|nr:unnamed protein product [Brugia pahangi]